MEVETVKEKWGNQKAALKALEKGVTQAAKDMKAHKAQAEKEVQRKQKLEQKKKEKEQLEARKESSDQRAKAILRGQEERLVPARLQSVPGSWWRKPCQKISSFMIFRC